MGRLTDEQRNLLKELRSKDFQTVKVVGSEKYHIELIHDYIKPHKVDATPEQFEILKSIFPEPASAIPWGSPLYTKDIDYLLYWDELDDEEHSQEFLDYQNKLAWYEILMDDECPENPAGNFICPSLGV